jgi:hypothetical protein
MTENIRAGRASVQLHGDEAAVCGLLEQRLGWDCAKAAALVGELTDEELDALLHYRREARETAIIGVAAIVYRARLRLARVEADHHGRLVRRLQNL